MPTARRLSGHKSSTQNTIGAPFAHFIMMAGRPTVIGDGSNTKMQSNFRPRNLSKPNKEADSTKLA